MLCDSQVGGILGLLLCSWVSVATKMYGEIDSVVSARVWYFLIIDNGLGIDYQYSY